MHKKFQQNQLKMVSLVIANSSLKEAIKTLDGQGFNKRFLLQNGLIKTPQKFLSITHLYILEKMPFEDEDFEEATIYGLITKCGQKGFLVDIAGEFDNKLQEVVRNLC